MKFEMLFKREENFTFLYFYGDKKNEKNYCLSINIYYI
jgi:hypothetical protein